MRPETEKELASLRERWATHELTEHVHVPGKLTAYYLKRPGEGRMSSCYIVFTVEGIVIMGDWCPGEYRNGGVISSLGYGEGWFSGSLSASYLAEKFLSRRWVPEFGYSDMRHEILEARRHDSITRDAARDAWDALIDVGPSDLSVDLAYKIYHDAGLEDFDLGYGYEPFAHALLIATQERFAACKAALVAQTPAAVAA